MNRREALLVVCMAITGCGGREDTAAGETQNPTKTTESTQSPAISRTDTTTTITEDTEENEVSEIPAGCSPPDATQDPISYLPEVSEASEWTSVDTHGEAAGMINAEVGVTRVYQSGGGFEYSVSVFRFASKSDARDGMAVFRGNQMFAYWVVLGNYGFAAGGDGKDPDRDGVEETPLSREQEKRQTRALLLLSPVLTEQCLKASGEEVTG